MKNKIFVVALIYEGVKVYFVRGGQKPFLEGSILMSEPCGFFHPNIKDAKKFTSRDQAEYCASYFEGAGVEVIASAERLK